MPVRRLLVLTVLCLFSFIGQAGAYRVHQSHLSNKSPSIGKYRDAALIREFDVSFDTP